MRKGIIIAGSIIVDLVNRIDKYPEATMLARIIDVERNIGGCVANTGIDLKRIDPDLPVYAYGLVGNDEEGRFAIDEMVMRGMDCNGVKKIASKGTSHAIVMSDQESKLRTFFHYTGANEDFGEDTIADVDWSKISMFHLGYLTLLKNMDESDPEYGTKAAKLLAYVKSKGVKTSIDMISEDSDKVRDVIAPALRYCDNVIINETEGSLISGIDPYVDSKIDDGQVAKICRKLMDMGVSERVIIHSPRRAFCLNSKGEFVAVDSFVQPKGYIKSTVGAGDAFCAGALYSIQKGVDDKRILQFANCTADYSLSELDSVSGVRPFNEVDERIDAYYNA